MKILPGLLLAATVLVFFCFGAMVGYALLTRKLTSEANRSVIDKPIDPKHGIIHMPKEGKCPPGYTLIKDFFHREGKGFDACQKDGSDSTMIDYLLPGEAVDMIIRIPLPQEGKDKI